MRTTRQEGEGDAVYWKYRRSTCSKRKILGGTTRREPRPRYSARLLFSLSLSLSLLYCSLTYPATWPRLLLFLRRLIFPNALLKIPSNLLREPRRYPRTHGTPRAIRILRDKYSLSLLFLYSSLSSIRSPRAIGIRRTALARATADSRDDRAMNSTNR